MLRKKSIINLLESLVVLTIILDLNSVYSIILKMSSGLRISFFCIILLSILILIRKTTIKINKNQMFFLFIYILGLIGINYFLNKSGIKTILIYYCFIFFLFYIYFTTYGKEAIISMINKYIKIVIILSIISLFFWIFGDVFKIIKSNEYVPIDFGAGILDTRNITSYYKLHFDTQKVSINNWEIIRNSGVFAEAPMFAMIIIIAIMFQLFVKKVEFSKFNIILLFITILTTTSATGILCAMLMLFLYLSSKKLQIKILNQLKNITLPLIFCIVLILSFNILNDKSETTSFSNRALDYKNAFNIFLQKPLFGEGISHEHEYEGDLLGYGYSNSISKIITDGGIYLLLFYAIALIRLIKYGKHVKDKNIIIIAIICMLSSFLIIFVHNILSIFLVSIAYALNNKNEKEEINV